MFSGTCSLPLSHNRSHPHQFIAKGHQRGSLRPQAGGVVTNQVSCAFQQSTRLGSLANAGAGVASQHRRREVFELVNRVGGDRWLSCLRTSGRQRCAVKGCRRRMTLVCVRACDPHICMQTHPEHCLHVVLVYSEVKRVESVQRERVAIVMCDPGVNMGQRCFANVSSLRDLDGSRRSPSRSTNDGKSF